MIIPTHVDVLLPRKPIANYVLMGMITLTSTVYLLGWMPSEYLKYFVARDYSQPSGLFLSVFLHLDFLHLGGNMLFQFVFGNAVCSKIGNWRFLILYFLFELASSVCHVQFSQNGALGASGAINGIIGFYFALYPRNYIYVFYWFYITLCGHSRVPGYVLIIMWFLMDFFGAMTDGGMVAYWAHIGGFAGGILIGAVFLKMKWVHFHKVDQDHLFSKFFGRFNVDEITQDMVDACRLLGEKELKVRVGEMDDVSYPASILYRMMETRKARGDDEVFNDRTGKWQNMTEYFGTLALTPEMLSRKSEAIENDELPITSYFIVREGQNYGPYKVLDLKNSVANGEIREDELIFEQDTHNWMKVKDVI